MAVVEQEWPAESGSAGGNGLYCWTCGSTPAVRATIRGHQGLLVKMRFLKRDEMFCRDCGLAVFRRMQGDSLWQGWWSALSVLINPVVLLHNLGERAKLLRLGAPVPGAPHAPLDPGKPLTRRPQIIGMVMPLMWAATLILGAFVSPPEEDAAAQAAGSNTTYPTPPVYAPPAASLPYGGYAPYGGAGVPTGGSPAPDGGANGIHTALPGECVWNRHAPIEVDDDAPDIVLVPCTDPNAQARVLGKVSMGMGEFYCEHQHPETDVVYTEELQGGYGFGTGLSGLTVCLDLLN